MRIDLHCHTKKVKTGDAYTRNVTKDKFFQKVIEAEVKIIFENDLIGVVVDRFGSDIFITKEDDRHFKAVIKVEVSPTFMGWILSFGSRAKIISPDYVVGKIKEYITET